MAVFFYQHGTNGVNKFATNLNQFVHCCSFAAGLAKTFHFAVLRAISPIVSFSSNAPFRKIVG